MKDTTVIILTDAEVAFLAVILHRMRSDVVFRNGLSESGKKIINELEDKIRAELKEMGITT